MLAITDLTVIENHARISDIRVQEALQFGRIIDLHRVIEKNLPELETYGRGFCQSGKKPLAGLKGGRPTKEYMLTEEQAVLVCMFARTPQAATARKMIVDVFMAWRRGEALPQPGGEGITITKDDYIALLLDQNILLSLKAAVKTPRKPPVPLTSAEKAKIISLTAQGLSNGEIARQTGRSTATISLLRNGFRIINGGDA